VESTAVYPTKYYAEQFKDVDPRFYVERRMVVTIPQRNPNAHFNSETILLPGSITVEYFVTQRLGEEIPIPRLIPVPLLPFVSKTVIKVTGEDIQRALQSDIIKELGEDHLSKQEIIAIKQKLSSWIDEITQRSELKLTEEAKILLIHIITLIMKKTNDFIKQCKG
jgi:hypothetical protein